MQHADHGPIRYSIPPTPQRRRNLRISTTNHKLETTSRDHVHPYRLFLAHRQRTSGRAREACSRLPAVAGQHSHRPPSLFAGPPAMTPRDVVDNSYSVGLSVILDDSAGHDVYQKHPLHLDFIKANK